MFYLKYDFPPLLHPLILLIIPLRPLLLFHRQKVGEIRDSVLHNLDDLISNEFGRVQSSNYEDRNEDRIADLTRGIHHGDPERILNAFTYEWWFET